MDSDSDFSDIDDIVAQMLLDGSFTVAVFDESSDDDTPRVRSVNKKRSFVSYDSRFNLLYFNQLFVYTEADFERRFRMPRSVFDRFMTGISGRDIFTQLVDTTHTRGSSPHMRVIAALRVLAYGKSFNEVDDLW